MLPLTISQYTNYVNYFRSPSTPAARKQHHPPSLYLLHPRSDGMPATAEDIFSGECLCSRTYRAGLEHSLAWGNSCSHSLVPYLLTCPWWCPAEVIACLAQGLDNPLASPDSNHQTCRCRLFTAPPERMVQPWNKKYMQQMMTALWQCLKSEPQSDRYRTIWDLELMLLMLSWIPPFPSMQASQLQKKVRVCGYNQFIFPILLSSGQLSN